ncbi:MAG: NfeD family protein [Pirellulales bacterium]
MSCLGAVVLLGATTPAQQPGNEKVPADAERAPAAAKEKTAKGVLVRLSLPINDNGSSRFIRTVRRALPKLPAADPRPVLIIEFSVGQSKDGLGSDFHSASRLAEFLISDELQHVKTVAYIPETIRGHGVLAALACREIVMAPDAEIGDAGVDEPDKIPIRKETYDRIARATLTVQPAVALKMLDKDLDVRKVVFAGGAGGAEYVLADKVEEIKKERNVTEVISLKDGNLFSGQEARSEPRFVSHLATSRSELAKQLGVDARVLRESPLASDVKPIQVTISGEMTSKLAAEVMRQIDDNVEQAGANFVVVRIDSPGGNSSESQKLANHLARLNPERVHTVAYIENEAAGDAAIIALACDEIIMHPTAVLGGDGALDLNLNDGRGKQEIEMAVSTYREGVAKPKSRSWSIGAAIIDPSLKVYRYTNKSSGLVEYWSEDEAKEELKKDPQAWLQGPLIASGVGRLALTGAKAEEYGVITKTVENFEELKNHYDVDDPALVDPTWVDKLLRFLASPNVALFLLLIGGAAVYAELQTPGVGLGGMIAFICFLLFFWAKVFDGTAGALEILLFAAGLACVVIEVFVLPGIGMGIFALGGGLMIIVSLVLASQTFILPHSSYELRQMTNSLLVVGGAAVGTVAAIAGLRRWLPHAPIFNRMLLAPPSPEESEHIDQRESLVNYEHLLGRSGTAVTHLAPSGKAHIGDELVDVITAGEFVDRDSQVVVIEVRGNCVVVGSAQV